MTRPWAAYLRVSTDLQAESGLGMAAQRTKIEAWAAYQGREIGMWFIDAGESAKTMDRPAWGRCEGRLRAGEFEGLVVHSLSRLSRSTLDLLSLVDDLFTGDDAPAFASLDLGVDTSTPIGRFVLVIFAGLNQLERDQVSERTRSAMAEAKSQGRIVGPVPVGRRDRGDGFHEDDPDQFACWLFVGDIDSFTEAASVANEGGLRRAGGSPWDRKSIKRLFDTAEKYGWER